MRKDASMAGSHNRELTFKKCDLHIHSSSDYSRCNTPGYNRDGFFETLATSDFDVIGITDHNSIDVSMLSELSDKLAGTKTLLAGVELNLKLKDTTIERYELHVNSDSGKNYFHSIILTSMDYMSQLADAVDQLFIDAKIVTQVDVNNANSGNITRAEYSKKTDGRAIYLEEMQEAFANIPHFFIPHVKKSDRNLEDYLPTKGRNSQKNKEYRDRLFYYSNGFAVEGNDPQGKITNRMAYMYNTTIPTLLFSDPQVLSDIGEKYTWIDFDGTLDSLLLAISDPESRIRTSEVCPDLPQKNTASYLQCIDFDVIDTTQPNGTRHVEIPFAPGFNGVVGSRGSGKSMLAHILSKSNLEDYKKLLLPDTIGYTLAGGNRVTDSPKYLYMSQGELEDIFKSGDYRSIPIIKHLVDPAQKNAQEKSENFRIQINGFLDLQKDLIDAFTERYSDVVSLSVLDNPEPLGTDLEVPKPPKQNDSDLFSGAKQCVEKFNNDLKVATNEIEKFKITASYPEDAELFEAVSNEISGICADAKKLASRTQKLSEVLDSCDEAWFFPREELIRLFIKKIKKENKEQNSALHSDYIKKKDRALGFLNDLLKLRFAFNQIDSRVKSLRDSELSPIDPQELSDEGTKIRIKTYYEDSQSFAGHITGLLKGGPYNNSEQLIRACLFWNEPSKVRSLFNGNQIKGIQRTGLSQSYIDNYFAKLKDAFSRGKEQKISVSVDGTDIADMSPGMRADALIKLFLNDGSDSGKYTYIILDQPEDNLDVKTISDFLVKRLKSLKLSIQIFVISHSAPVIVNGDARQVILSESSKNGISYKFGSLNDACIKNEVAEVLDGGERYLKMRLNKYNFQIGGK